MRAVVHVNLHGIQPSPRSPSRQHEPAVCCGLPGRGVLGGCGAQGHDQSNSPTPHQRLTAAARPNSCFRAFAWVGGNRSPRAPPTAQNRLPGVQTARHRPQLAPERAHQAATTEQAHQHGTEPCPSPSASPRCSAAAQPCPSGREKSTGWRRRSPSCLGWTPSRACPVQWQQQE